NPQEREFISRKSIESISNLKSRNRMTLTLKGGTRHAIYPWNQSKASKIENPQEREFISRKSIESISNRAIE
ncbi:hypothetical protein QUA94_35010, partial [Microcoleus sp. F8-D2]